MKTLILKNKLSSFPLRRRKLRTVLNQDVSQTFVTVFT